ncbi:MAG: hypothetical protein ACYC3X_28600 [Pirellulaceae bacterium]
MGRLPWKKDKVFAVETRPKLWAIGQMLEDPYVAFFDLFTQKPADMAVDLGKCRVLFVCAVTRQFIGRSSTMRLTLAPRKPIEIPTLWIKAYPGTDERSDEEQIVVFKGTKHERRTWMWPGARLVKESGRRYCSPKFVADIDPNDEATVVSYELTNIRMYPELNERLYLCHKLGKNVDPLKDLILRRKIPLIYKRYVDI